MVGIREMFRESFGSYYHNLTKYIFASALYAVALGLILGACMGIPMLTLIFLLASGQVNVIGSYALAFITVVMLVVTFFFWSIFKGGFICSTFAIYSSNKGIPALGFLELSFSRAKRFFILEVLRLGIVCLVLVPLLVANYYYYWNVFAGASLFAIVAFVWLVSSLVDMGFTANAIERVRTIPSLVKGLRAIAKQPIAYLAALIVTTIFTLVFASLPLVGLFFLVFFLWPWVTLTYLVFYQKAK